MLLCSDLQQMQPKHLLSPDNIKRQTTANHTPHILQSVSVVIQCRILLFVVHCPAQYRDINWSKMAHVIGPETPTAPHPKKPQFHYVSVDFNNLVYYKVCEGICTTECKQKLEESLIQLIQFSVILESFVLLHLKFWSVCMKPHRFHEFRSTKLSHITAPCSCSFWSDRYQMMSESGRHSTVYLSFCSAGILQEL